MAKFVITILKKFLNSDKAFIHYHYPKFKV